LQVGATNVFRADEPFRIILDENRTHPKNNHFIGKVSENEATTSHFFIGKVVTGQWNPMDLMPDFQTNPEMGMCQNQ